MKSTPRVPAKTGEIATERIIRKSNRFIKEVYPSVASLSRVKRVKRERPTSSWYWYINRAGRFLALVAVVPDLIVPFPIGAVERDGIADKASVPIIGANEVLPVFECRWHGKSTGGKTTGATVAAVSRRAASASGLFFSPPASSPRPRRPSSPWPARPRARSASWPLAAPSVPAAGGLPRP